jgi:hypothetical protein
MIIAVYMYIRAHALLAHSCDRASCCGGESHCHIVPCFRCLEGAFVDVRGSDWGSGKVHSSSEEFAKGFTRKQSFPSCVVNEHGKSERVTSMRIFVAFAYMLLVIKL